MRVDCPVERLAFVSTDGIEQLGAREHAARLAGERRQELELGGREIDRGAVAVERQALGIEHEIAESQSRACGRPGVARGTPEHGLHPRHELTRAEGFGEVVVGAGFEAEQPVRLLGAGREHDDRHRRTGSERPRDLDAVHARQSQVQDDQSGFLTRTISSACAPSPATATV